MLHALKHIRPGRFFLMAALLFELLLNVVTPPLQAPDEFSHFYRAYQISEGYFLPLKQEQRLGGYMPAGITDFTDQYKQSAYSLNYTLTYSEIWRSCKIDLQPEARRFTDFANTAYYSPVSYLPQACALFMLRQFNAPPALMYYFTRLFVFLVWLLAMYWVIQTLPVFKWLFTALILLPMQPYVVNSFSADTVTNILAFLFTALVLKHVFVSRAITGRQLLTLALLLALLALAKVVYIGLLLLLPAIPARKFVTRGYRFMSLALLLLGPAALAVFWQSAVMQLYIPFKDYNAEFRAVACLSPCGDYYGQQAYILSHGLYFFKVIWRSLFAHSNTYLSGYIGVFGNGDIGLPAWLYVLVYSLLLVLALTEKNAIIFTTAQKWWVFMAAACALVLLLLSQHLIWDCVGEGIVDLLQGRYLIPVFPLLFLLFSNRAINVRFNPGVLVIPAMTVLYSVSIFAIYQRFFKGPPVQQLTTVYCDAEETDAYGSFKTSDATAWFGNAGNRSSREHRSGSFSALLSPQAPFCFTYTLKGLHTGDLVEVEAWQKGRGTLLVMSGNKEGCSDFYFAGTYNSYCDKDGWQRIKNVCPVTWNCDSSVIRLYAWNPGKTTIYLDDIKLSIKKFKAPD